jgi:hypothetical protein
MVCLKMVVVSGVSTIRKVFKVSVQRDHKTHWTWIDPWLLCYGLHTHRGQEMRWCISLTTRIDVCLQRKRKTQLPFVTEIDIRQSESLEEHNHHRWIGIHYRGWLRRHSSSGAHILWISARNRSRANRRKCSRFDIYSGKKLSIP